MPDRLDERFFANPRIEKNPASITLLLSHHRGLLGRKEPLAQVFELDRSGSALDVDPEGYPERSTHQDTIPGMTQVELQV